MVALIDYGMGNLRSVERALQKCGASVRVVSEPQGLSDVKGVVFPGQGAFGDCMLRLQESELGSALREWILSGGYYLGICLGLQALFETSEEALNITGLGIVRGRVVKFGAVAPMVPHMGWNSVCEASSRCSLFKGIADGEYFYFDHSFYGQPLKAEVEYGVTEHGAKFPSVLWRRNLYGVQFHPEKSQEVGLKLLQNFLELCGEVVKSK